RRLHHRDLLSFPTRRSSDLSISWRSCARFSSNQKTAGVPERRALLTANFTQSRIGASLVWHIRKISPALTTWVINTFPSASTTWIVPLEIAWKVLSCEPYSSAFWAISPTFDTDPIVDGSNAPCCLQSAIVAAYTPAYERSG